MQPPTTQTPRPRPRPRPTLRPALCRDYGESQNLSHGLGKLNGRSVHVDRHDLDPRAAKRDKQTWVMGAGNVSRLSRRDTFFILILN